jgi:hypothetical protein
VADSNAFMDSLMDVESGVAKERDGESSGTTAEDGMATVVTKPVKELSRLWKYRNGMSPVDWS